MERLGLTDRRKDLVETLSGGLRGASKSPRRCCTARRCCSWTRRPPGSTRRRAATSRGTWRTCARHEGVTILLTTHILEEADRCDRLVLLHQGNIVAQGQSGRTAFAHRRRRGGAGNRRRRRRWRRRSSSASALQPVVRDGQVRVEIANGHRFIAEVVEAFPGAIDSVGLHKPIAGRCLRARNRSRRLNSFVLPAATLWQRELVRFWRQKSRVLAWSRRRWSSGC